MLVLKVLVEIGQHWRSYQNNLWTEEALLLIRSYAQSYLIEVQHSVFKELFFYKLQTFRRANEYMTAEDGTKLTRECFRNAQNVQCEADSEVTWRRPYKMSASRRGTPSL